MFMMTVTWCFTPSQPLRLYQGDYEDTHFVFSECLAYIYTWLSVNTFTIHTQ